MNKFLKRGFSLVELLVVIIVVGIILIISFPIINNVLRSFKNNFYNNQENGLLFSGKDYFSDHELGLPKTIGEAVSINLKTLIEEGYSKEILDIDKKLCDIDKSLVEVTNINKGIYNYSAILICDNYNTEDSYGPWSAWQTTIPIGSNIEIESKQLYNYQTATTFYTDWTNWTDVAINDSPLLPVEDIIINTETDSRIIYQYRDQQWKWYKQSWNWSAYFEYASYYDWENWFDLPSSDIEAKSCNFAAKNSDGAWIYCSCITSTTTCPYTVGGTVSSNASCTVPSGFNNTVSSITTSKSMYRVKQYATVNICSETQPTAYGETFTKGASCDKYYPNDTNQTNGGYTSNVPTGYPNKDITQTQYTAWSDWDISIPTNYDYREVNNKNQTRTRQLIKSWSGNILPYALDKAEFEATMGKSISEIELDPLNRYTKTTMYRYRTKIK